MTHVTCRLTAKNRDQLRKSSIGYLYLFYYLHKFWWPSVKEFLGGGGQISPSPIDFHRRPYNTLPLPCEHVIIVRYRNIFCKSDRWWLAPDVSLNRLFYLSRPVFRCFRRLWFKRQNTLHCLLQSLRYVGLSYILFELFSFKFTFRTVQRKKWRNVPRTMTKEVAVTPALRLSVQP